MDPIGALKRPEVEIPKFVPVALIMYAFLAIEKLFAFLSWFSNKLAGEREEMASPRRGARYLRAPRP